MNPKREIIQWIVDHQDAFIQIADSIWEHPEIALKEFHASKLQADTLTAHGFHVKWGSGGMPTAFIAEWGKGKPIIGFLGEYDALSNLSQDRVTFQKPVNPGGLGQGCGHNLLGTGALASAIAIKYWLDRAGVEGTVRYYGCPAEEALIGKVFMAREGAFNDLDAAFNFHPWYVNRSSKGSFVALNNLKFHFYGKTSHAGAAPHLGRSALDGVELMNVGVNYLREHVESTARIHYVITNGGDLPNIVPSDAEVWYFVRAPTRKQVEGITDRIRKIAQGAALMTETRVEEIFITGCYEVLNNSVLADLQTRILDEIGPIEFTDEEMEFARQINERYPEETRQNIYQSIRFPKFVEPAPLYGENYPPYDKSVIETGSSDVGDVSWIAPLAMLFTACWPSGAAGHSWGIVAAGGTSIGHKGMLHAAKAMAAAASELYTTPDLLAEVRKEFELVTKQNLYQSPLPSSVQSPV